MSSKSAKTYYCCSANGEFGDPLDPPKSPPGPGPAQKKLWEGLGELWEGLEELWEALYIDQTIEGAYPYNTQNKKHTHTHNFKIPKHSFFIVVLLNFKFSKI